MWLDVLWLVHARVCGFSKVEVRWRALSPLIMRMSAWVVGCALVRTECPKLGLGGFYPMEPRVLRI